MSSKDMYMFIYFISKIQHFPFPTSSPLHPLYYNSFSICCCQYIKKFYNFLHLWHCLIVWTGSLNNFYFWWVISLFIHFPLYESEYTWTMHPKCIQNTPYQTFPLKPCDDNVGCKQIEDNSYQRNWPFTLCLTGCSSS